MNCLEFVELSTPIAHVPPEALSPKTAEATKARAVQLSRAIPVHGS